MSSDSEYREIVPEQHNHLISLCDEMGMDAYAVEGDILLDEDGNVASIKICNSDAESIPQAFGSYFPQLRRLIVCRCMRLKDVSAIGRCRFLEELKLACGRLKELPPTLGNLSELQILRLGFNEWPVTQNDRLCVSHCGGSFKTLPREIGQLSKLRLLQFLSCPELESIPETIGNLKELETLLFSCCDRLPELPLPTWKLPKLKLVEVRGEDTLRETTVPDIKEFSVLHEDDVDEEELLLALQQDRNWFTKVSYYPHLNRAGRRLLYGQNVSDALWSNVLGRCSESRNSLYFFLREKPDMVSFAMSHKEVGRKRKIDIV